MSWQCDCEGFVPLRGALSDATFAAATPPNQGDPLAVPLRLARPL
jgi:hypothetical protein